MADGEYMRLRSACAAPDCGLTVQARSLCITHYSRWRRNGSIADPAPFFPLTCTADDCLRQATRKGLCKKHYQRTTYKAAAPREVRPATPGKKHLGKYVSLNGGRACAVEGCSGQSERKGFCAPHWHRWHRFGDALADLKCTYCGEPCPLDGCTAEFCSHRCLKRQLAGLSNKIACLVCEQLFRTIKGSVTCSDACKEARKLQVERTWAKQQQDDPAYQERRRMAQQRRRLRQHSGEAEMFSFREIALRDRWRCGLCGDRVQQGLRHPDPMSGSVDHILPVCAGGSHTRTNVQLAHLRCNKKKSYKPQGQLLLIG